jgi:NagD protein
VGKPSAWIIRSALNHIDGHSEDTVIIGDNMRTDILAGFQAGLETILVTSGVSKLEDIDKEPFRPNHVFACAGDIDVV